MDKEANPGISFHCLQHCDIAVAALASYTICGSSVREDSDSIPT